jgi:hypothetical protein
MARFLSDAVLQEVHLNGHLYMWSNERAHPTLEQIDRVFISNQWDAIFMDCELHALSSLCSDHAPSFFARVAATTPRNGSTSGRSCHTAQVSWRLYSRHGIAR